MPPQSDSLASYPRKLLSSLGCVLAALLFRLPYANCLVAVWNQSAFSLDDLLLDDPSTYRSHTQLRMLLLMYRYLLAYVCMHFCCSIDSAPTLPERLAFVMLFLYLTLRVRWLSGTAFVSTRMNKLWLFVDAVLGYIVNMYANRSDGVESTLCIVSIFVAVCMFSTCFLCNLAVVIIASVVGSCWHTVGIGNGLKFTAKRAVIHVTLYCLIAWLIRVYNTLLEGYAQKCAQECRKAETNVQEKGMFVASASHDLKNPLNSILACLDLILLSEKLDSADKKNVKTAICSGQVLQYLVGNILDSSRMDTGNFDVDLVPLSLEAEVKKILKIESQLAAKKGIALYKCNTTLLPKRVFGDAMRVAQVIMNLVGNAIKFTTRGYVAVMLRWARNVDEVRRKTEDDHDDLIPLEGFFAADKTKVFCSHRVSPSTRADAKSDDTDEDLGEPVHARLSRYESLSKPSSNSRGHVSPRKLKLKLQLGLPFAGKRQRTPKSLFAVSHDPAKDQCDFSHYYVTESDERAPEDTHPPMPSTGINLSMARKLGRRRVISVEGAEAEAKMEEEDRKRFGGNGILVMDVIDTGEGMTDEEVERLFQPFTQANNKVRSQFGGTGLGLWITKRLVERMSGLVEVKSQRHRGTRFRVALPLKVVQSGDDSTSAALNVDDEEEGKENEPSGKLSGGLKKRICGASQFSTAVADIRKNGKLHLPSPMGEKGAAELRVLMVEGQRGKQEDLWMSQVLEQLSGHKCEITYTTYLTTTKKLRERRLLLDSIIVVATAALTSTKKLLTGIIRVFTETGVKPIPVIVIAGRTSHMTIK